MLTGEQKNFINDVRYRIEPYVGLTDRNIDTGLWFDEFIKPASIEPSLRIVVPDGWIASRNELAPYIATLVYGNPYAAEARGRGVLCNVRMGYMPPRPVTGALWRGAPVAATPDQMRKRFVAKDGDLVYNSWPMVTIDLLSRQLIRLTPALRMLLGTSGT